MPVANGKYGDSLWTSRPDHGWDKKSLESLQNKTRLLGTITIVNVIMVMAIFSLSKLFSSHVLSKSTPSPPPKLAVLTTPTSLQLPRTIASGLVAKTSSDGDITSVVWPSLAHANILNFFNVQIKVDDDEPEERILNRFRRSVLRAGILQESKRRRFFESNQDKKKRKARAAAQRNRKRRGQRKGQAKNEAPKKSKDDEEEDDNWEVPEGDIPYCNF